MHNSKVTKGGHRSTVENKQLDPEVLKLMKSQDLGYITHRKSIDDGKIRKLKENLHLIGKKKPKSHKVFCEDEEEFDETYDVIYVFLATITNIAGKKHAPNGRLA